ncbi:unnamed protein product [Caenorhabditis bovis]|uniref:G-protein coupled receptors family 1 profile domain-containing protein n=1 Tax=Caenorhabditis bovis TaxID=2654633 RepID=A0A8S1F4K7_9PELO|nr:unnamed protein product [Caenorhabditis bovis]
MSFSSKMLPDEPPTWPLQVYYGMSIVTFPIYFLVFLSLLRLRKESSIYRTTFYTIFLQHCIADQLAMAIFMITYGFRKFSYIRQFFYTYQNYYIAGGTYTSIYYFLNIRCCGIVLLSLQRFSAIILPLARLTEMVQNLRIPTIALIYWLLPTILSIPTLLDTDFKYDNIEEMNVMTNKEVIMKNSRIALIVVGATCSICLMCYTSIIIFVHKNSTTLSRSLRRELHLAFQVFALFGAFVAMFIYYAFQNYFAKTMNTGPIFTMRALYPIANGLLSYINPFCILMLNRDFRRQLQRIWTLREMTVRSAFNPPEYTFNFAPRPLPLFFVVRWHLVVPTVLNSIVNGAQLQQFHFLAEFVKILISLAEA